MTVKTLQRECVGLKAENKILKNKVLQLTEELDSKMKMITEPTSGPNLSFPSSPTNASDGLPVQQNTLRPKPLVTLRPRGGRSLFPNTGETDATQHKQSPSVPITSTPHTGRSHQPRPDTGAEPMSRSFSQHQTSMPQTLPMSGGTPGYGHLKGKGKASVYDGAASASCTQHQSPYSHLYGPGMPPPTYPPPQGQTGWYNRSAQL
ncbi:hypothetical protein V5O48_003643 [Marasmius crinis-equi]|uniref:Uncharacterized protein n=1 Tax=Marasmius crinis-equi TaxID=585013 RepID=A0ABR3FSA8_9AGAR